MKLKNKLVGLLAALASGCVACPAGAREAPQHQALSADECVVLGEIASAVVALKMHGVENGVADKVLSEIYVMVGDRQQALYVAVARYARASALGPIGTGSWLRDSCLKHEGDLTPVLGKAV